MGFVTEEKTVKFKALLKQRKKLLVVAGVAVLVLVLFVQVQPLDIGYLSGAQGLEPQFHSVYWHNSYWSSTEKGESPYGDVASSSRSFGFSMQFDPDETQKGMPDLCASTQTMTRESDVPVAYTWEVPQGTTTLPNGTTVRVAKQFEMYKYRMDWAMNLWLTGSEWEADGKYYDLGLLLPKLYVDGGAYSSAELWIKLVPKNFVYFTDNPDNVYFAPAYIALQEPVRWIGTEADGTQTLNDPDIAAINDIIPESTGETLGIYYQRGGGDTLTSSELLSYQGLTLDSSVFRSEYWTRINLVEFQAHSWMSWVLIHGWKYPSAYMHFMVDLFVVGEWTVYYQTGEVPGLTPHLPVVQIDILTQIGAWLGNPFNQMYLWFIVIVAVLILVTVLNPGIWGTLAGRRRKE